MVAIGAIAIDKPKLHDRHTVLCNGRSAEPRRTRQLWDDQGNTLEALSPLLALHTGGSPKGKKKKKRTKKKLLESVHDDDNFGCTGKQGPGLLLESGDGGTACLTRLPVFFSFRCYGLQMPLDDSLPL